MTDSLDAYPDQRLPADLSKPVVNAVRRLQALPDGRYVVELSIGPEGVRVGRVLPITGTVHVIAETLVIDVAGTVWG